MDSTHDSPVCRPAYKAPSLNYALTVRAASIPGGRRTSEEAVMFINVQPVPWQHTSSHTINQPLTADVHLSPLRVMEVSLRDNSAGEAGLAVRPPESVIPRAGCEPIRVRRIISHQAEHPGHGKPCFHLIIYLCMCLPQWPRHLSWATPLCFMNPKKEQLMLETTKAKKYKAHLLHTMGHRKMCRKLELEVDCAVILRFMHGFLILNTSTNFLKISHIFTTKTKINTG